MAGHNKKKYPLDRILQRAEERTSKAVQITPTLAAEYLEHIEEIMRLKRKATCVVIYWSEHEQVQKDQQLIKYILR